MNFGVSALPATYRFVFFCSVIFSGFVNVLSAIESFLKEKGLKEGNDFGLLIGGSSSDERQIMIDRFNKPNDTKFRVMLVSARAGGEGIDLTGANRCVLVDCSWNPATDLQSVFRVYRLGQKKPCYVYRMLAAGTMEEKIYNLSLTKQNVADRVLDDIDLATSAKTVVEGDFFKYLPGPKEEICTDKYNDEILKSILNEKTIEVLR